MSGGPFPGGRRHALYAGDAREGLRWFLAQGFKARAAYLDPPFLTGKDFGAYRDAGGREELLALLGEVVALCREALAEDGSLFLHVDHRLSAHARLLLDRLFGEDRFLNEIIWAYESGGRAKRHFSRKHDTILWYGKGKRTFFAPEAVGIPRTTARGNHMRRAVDEGGRAYASIRSGGREYRYYDDETVPPSDVWADIPHLQQRDPERTGYPTQKPLKLLTRIVLAASGEGDIVLDPFCGSGTTLAAAEATGRHGFGVDASAQAPLALAARLPGDLCAVL